MSTSHKNGRTASKVLKVALSAALAAAFTPMVAAPAFATTSGSPVTAATVDEQVATVLADVKTAMASPRLLFIDGSDDFDVYFGYDYGSTDSTQSGQTAVKNGLIKSDLTVFFYRLADQSPSGTTLRYDGKIFSWDSKNKTWACNTETSPTYLPAAIADKTDGQGHYVIDSILESNRSANYTFGISFDGGETYTDVDLHVQVNTAKIVHASGAADDKVYGLAEALNEAGTGDTVVMTSNAVSKDELVLKPGVTLNGNGHTLTHLANTRSNSNPTTAQAALKVTSGTAAAVVQNLNIVGPNTTPATTDDTGAVTPNEDKDYAIRADGSGVKLTLKGVTVSRAESAVLASGGATVTIDGTLNVSGTEVEAIELAGASTLELTSKAAVYYSETEDKPFVCSDGNGSIKNSTSASTTKLAKTLVKAGEHHYFLSSAPTNGAAYLYQANELGTAAQSFNLGGNAEYAMLAYTPETSGTYCFASAGTTDVAAEVYTMTNKGALGTKVASGDNEQGENFRVFAKLTGGSTYILRVGISAAQDSASGGNFTLAVTEAEAKRLDSYVATLPANTYYYSDDEITAAKLSVTAKSSIDGTVLASTKYEKKICNLNGDGTVNTSSTVDTINTAGRYALVLTPATGSGLQNDTSTFCYFDVLDAGLIKDYNFSYNNTLVLSSNQTANITLLAPKGYRHGKSTAVFSEANVAVKGWYKVTDGVVGEKLPTAPSETGTYAMRIAPSDASDPTTNYIDLKFSITRGKVAIPTARTGLTYTGSAQTGVAATSSSCYVSGGTATNAGTYTAYATLAEGYSWSDGTTDPKTITWSIAKAKIAVPTGAANLTYTGKVQTGVAAGTGYTLSGTTTATEPGTYTCTATPSANYTWTDGTSTSKTVTWTLGKAPAGITATPSSVVVDEGTKAVVSLKQAGTAAYTVTSSNANVATATVSGSIVTITAKASGSATITVSTAATARYAAGTCTIAVSVPKAEGASGSAVDPTTKATNKFKVTTSADPDDPDVKPTVAFTGTNATGKFTIPATVTLADGVTYKVTSIASKAFDGEGVTQVTVPKGITKIGTYAFRDCTKLTKVTLPSTLKEISSSAFSGCTKLTSVSIASGKVGKNAFKNCKKLSSVTLGSKVSSVGASALKGAKATTITIKTSKLSKTSIKNLVKDSKLTTIKCSGLSKTVKAKYSSWAKTYKWSVKVK